MGSSYLGRFQEIVLMTITSSTHIPRHGELSPVVLDGAPALTGTSGMVACR